MSLIFETISVETIRPASPTPHLRTYQFSHWDLISLLDAYSTFIFFYQSNSDTHNLGSFFTKSRVLKSSLSKTLVHYYPLAGRLRKDRTGIECNDEGAHFVEVVFRDNLSNFLKRPDVNLLRNFIPEVDPNSVSKALLVVQLTHFDCGGIAISVHISHRVVDAASMCTFIKSWISTIHEHDNVSKPVFLESSWSPPEYVTDWDPDHLPTGEFVTKRFVFNLPNIEALTAKLVCKVNEEQNMPFSNTDVIMAIIMKSAITASRIVSGTSGPTLLYYSANMRKKVSPPFPDNSIGNIRTSVRNVFKENEIEISDIMRRNVGKLSEKKKVEITEREKLRNWYFGSSLTTFPIYESDFGWGKPLWVVCTPGFFKNLAILTGTRDDDGIEAWVSLDEKEMAEFERQSDIVAFGSLNPPLLINYSRL